MVLLLSAKQLFPLFVQTRPDATRTTAGMHQKCAEVFRRMLLGGSSEMNHTLVCLIKAASFRIWHLSGMLLGCRAVNGSVPRATLDALHIKVY